MKLVYHLAQIKKSGRRLVGGKAAALARMTEQNLPVPMAICISTEAYNVFLDETGLREQILMEYHRKPFDQMRWEEMWDSSLRIQNLFAKTSLPASLQKPLAEEIAAFFGQKAVAVRSSAISEDSSGSSFAGLHESYLNIRGPKDVLNHIKLVWASTWSDAAILYRKELGLDVEKSAMAVVVQELVHGQESGVIFGRSPMDRSKAVVEAVYGLNKGLVDGIVEPDRWIIERASGKIVSHTPAQRIQAVMPAPKGVKVVKLPAGKRNKPPLTRQRVREVFRLEKKLAKLFRAAQDVEWTYDHSKVRLLQSRPITATAGAQDKDDRQWYLTLKRSFENLVDLRTKIEEEIIPGMVAEAKSLSGTDLKCLTDIELAEEITRRAAICEKWKKQYWDFCIPFAHGIRLFGEVYNKTVQPENPYEFMDLLAGTPLQSVKRNEKMRRLAGILKKDKKLAAALRAKKLPENSKFALDLTALAEEMHTPMPSMMHLSQLRDKLLELIVEMAKAGYSKKQTKHQAKSNLEKQFLKRMPKKKRSFALQLLDLGRASYQLRDDDNIYMGRIKRRLLDAVQEARCRSAVVSRIPLDISRADEAAKCLKNPAYQPIKPKAESVEVQDRQIMPRQILGQPAGAGLATGHARVITNAEDLFAFKKREVLVCDAIEPNMTFVVPLASAVVERRGGMLIHGAIIAREYGLPCVTGVPDACTVIKAGDRITVDGYLGIVTLPTKGPLAE